MPRLIVLTDRSLLPLGRSLRAALAGCAAAGLRQVVVRELDLADPQRTDLVADLASLELTVVAARRPLPGCAGRLHLAADQQPTGGWFGRSCHSAEDVRRAAADGAAYATLSPYELTTSKPGYGPPVPRASFDGSPLPVFALGGISADNAAAARAAGAYGVAVMGAVMRADDPAAVVAALLEAVR